MLNDVVGSHLALKVCLRQELRSLVWPLTGVVQIHLQEQLEPLPDFHHRYHSHQT